MYIRAMVFMVRVFVASGQFMMIYVCRFVAASGRILIHDYDSVCFCYSTSAIYSDCWSFPHTFANVWASVWLPLNKA